MLSNVLALVGPMLSGKAIDAIEFGQGNVAFSSVYHYALLMILVYVISSTLSYLLSIIMIRLTQKIVCKMRNDVFLRLVDSPVGFFDTLPAGALL